MLRWAWKSLLAQWGSLLGSALGIASAFILVLFFAAVWRGESEQIVAYPQHVHPDIWVMQTGVGNMHMAMSFVWDWKADQIREMPGVKRVTPILYLNTAIRAGGTSSFAYVVGLLPDDEQRAGPWTMRAGHRVRQSGEAVIPDVMARLTGIGLDGQLRIADRSFRVVGLSTGTYSSANALIFVSFADLQDILSSGGTYSYLLVDAEEGVDVESLVVRIRDEVDKVNVLLHPAFIANDLSMAKQMGVDIIVIMMAICSVLAALIVGFTAFSLVARKRQEMAIIKALGFRNHRIFSSVIVQSVIVTALAFAIAAGFALLVMPYIPLLVPQLTLVVSIGSLFQLGVVALLVAVLGALAPAWQLLRLSPASAFRS